MKRQFLLCLALAAMMSVALYGFAAADVVITQKIESSMMGGLFSSNGTTTTMISGDKQKNETEMKMDLGIVSGPSTKETSIIRLDKGVAWNVNHDSKSYTESDLTAWQEMMESAGSPMGGDGDQPSDMPNYEDIEMNPPEITIERTGKKDKIAGYTCEEVILRMVMSGKDRETGDTGSFIVTDQMWVTKDCPGYDELRAHGEKTASKMSFSPTTTGSYTQMGALGIDTEELAAKMKEIDGYPMKQVMTMSISGEITSGGMTAEQRAESQQAMKDAKDALKNLGGLGGLFGGGKKDKEKKDEPKVEETDEGLAVAGAIMNVTIEVEDISTKSVNASEFEVPEGYKKSN